MNKERATFYYVTRGATDLITGTKGSLTRVALLTGKTYIDQTRLERRSDQSNVDVGRFIYKDRVFLLKDEQHVSEIFDGSDEFLVSSISPNGLISYEEEIFDILTVEVTDEGLIIYARGTGIEINFHQEGSLMTFSLEMEATVE